VELDFVTSLFRKLNQIENESFLKTDIFSSAVSHKYCTRFRQFYMLKRNERILNKIRISKSEIRNGSTGSPS